MLWHTVVTAKWRLPQCSTFAVLRTASAQLLLMKRPNLNQQSKGCEQTIWMQRDTGQPPQTLGTACCLMVLLQHALAHFPIDV